MKLKQIKYTLIAFVALFLISCESVFEGIDPQSNVSSSVIFNDLQGAQNALYGAYSQMQATGYYGRNIVGWPEALADNVRPPLNNFGRGVAQSRNDVRAHVDLWNTGYFMVNILNNILANIDNVPTSQANIDRIKGESLALRGLVYHDLVKIYGRNPNHIGSGSNLGVPLVLEPYTGGDVLPARATVDEIYDQVIADFNAAIPLLNDDNLANNRSEMSATAAKAFLARVHLYRGNWADAANLANDVINSAGIDLVSGANYLSAFSAGAESLFYVAFNTVESLGINNAINIYYIRRNNLGYGDGVMTDDLLSTWDQANDLRYQAISEVDNDRDGETVVYNLKYNAYDGQNADNVDLLRISEMYLIRAEANFENGSSVGAAPLDDINTLRTRAGLAARTTLSLADIMEERRLELAFEGHRFFDLKRRGMDITKGTPGTNDCPAGSCDPIPNGDFRVVNNIAQTELDVNPNLVQNPGYN